MRSRQSHKVFGRLLSPAHGDNATSMPCKATNCSTFLVPYSTTPIKPSADLGAQSLLQKLGLVMVMKRWPRFLLA